MSSGHHDDHHSVEQKPVSFTVPFILAAVTLIIIILFLSLCDPKAHHGDAAGHGDHHSVSTEATHHEAAGAAHHEAAEAKQPAAVGDSTHKEAAPAEHAGAEHH